LKRYSGGERRKFVRIPESHLVSRRRVKVLSFDGLELHRITAGMKDLSEGGVLFSSDRIFPIGAMLRLELDIPDWERYKMEFYQEQELVLRPGFSVLGRVIRVEEVSADVFDIGICFTAVEAGHKEALKRYVKRLSAA
jgi:hypothetical protein